MTRIGMRMLASVTVMSAALLLGGPAGLAFGDESTPASDNGADVCLSLNLLLVLLNVNIVLGPGQCPELTNPEPAGPPTAGPPTASLPVTGSQPPVTGQRPPATGRQNPAVRPQPHRETPPHRRAEPARPYLHAVSAAQVASGRLTGPVVHAGLNPRPAGAAPQAAPPQATPLLATPSASAKAPGHGSQPSPGREQAVPPTLAPAPRGLVPALEPGPVQSPAGYSATVPFDRVLRIPLQTPRLSTQQAALVVGIAVIGAALVSVGLPGRKDSQLGCCQLGCCECGRLSSPRRHRPGSPCCAAPGWNRRSSSAA